MSSRKVRVIILNAQVLKTMLGYFKNIDPETRRDLIAAMFLAMILFLIFFSN